MSILDLNLERHVASLKSGDSKAFDKIYEMTYRKIYFVVLPILRDRSLTEDIMQDTYLKFLEKINSYKAKNTLAYILTIARNLALNEYNRRKRETKDIDLGSDIFSVDTMLEISAANKELILSALAVLDPVEKDIFLLHNLENMTHREIALVLDKPLGTVTWIYQKAIKKMRMHLEGQDK